MADNPELLFAAYDPAIRSVDGRYWAWSSPMISTGLLDDAHTSVTRYDLCETPNSLDAEDLWGGCVGLSQQWCVFYRYYNGGRDLVGRPERAVMLFAFVNRKDALRYDGLQLLDEGPFSEWALLQPLPGCPPPPGIDCRITFMPHTLMHPSANAPLSKPVGGSLVKCNTVDDAWEALRSIQIDSRVLLKIRRNHGVWKKPELVRLENCSDRFSSNMSQFSTRIVNRKPRLDLQPSSVSSARKHFQRPRLKKVLKDYSAVIGLIVIALVVGWEIRRSFYLPSNPSPSGFRESPGTETDPIATDDHRNSRDRLPHGKLNEPPVFAPQHESEVPASEPDPSDLKSPNDSSQK